MFSALRLICLTSSPPLSLVLLILISSRSEPAGTTVDSVSTTPVMPGNSVTSTMVINLPMSKSIRCLICPTSNNGVAAAAKNGLVLNSGIPAYTNSQSPSIYTVSTGSGLGFFLHSWLTYPSMVSFCCCVAVCPREVHAASSNTLRISWFLDRDLLSAVVSTTVVEASFFAEPLAPLSPLPLPFSLIWASGSNLKFSSSAAMDITRARFATDVASAGLEAQITDAF
mmetsp:Transcript_15055/g.26196  ORF Transcript_15055/g.26196 Transcript_15055/m.26196 type:complete len:226 (+) Transcript_15055:1359-2036(+)